jgi:hypothetical protein
LSIPDFAASVGFLDRWHLTTRQAIVNDEPTPQSDSNDFRLAQDTSDSPTAAASDVLIPSDRQIE